MRQVMAVDDEYMILRGLPKLIDWQALGLTVAHTEQSPVAAIDYLRHQHVDILLSDMNMPELAGPQFLAEARRLQPNLQIIVLSGYGDFDYVKAGLEQGAVNYLRKPIDPDELVSALQAALTKLELADTQSQNAQLAKQVLARQAVTSRDQEAMHQALVQLSPDAFTVDPVHLIAFLNPLHHLELKNSLMHQPRLIGYYHDGRDVISLFGGTTMQVRQFIDHLPPAVGPMRRPVIVSAASRDIAALQVDAQRLRWAINRRYFFAVAKGLVMLPQQEPSETAFQLPGIEALKQDLHHVTALELTDWLQAQFDQLEQQDASVELTRQVAVIILLSMRAWHPEFELNSASFTRINNAATVGELIDVLLDAALVMAAATDKRYSRNVAAVVTIIQQRFELPLTLGEIATELHLSPVYLGQQFKKETGQTVAQYLNDYRINQSIQLLEQTEADVSEIAHQVGYQTTSYFFKTFKKQLNMSPGEYREVALS